MFGLRAVAGLTVDACVFARLLDLENVGVAAFACFMPRVDDGQRSDFGNGVSAIVSVLAETLRDEPGSERQEQGNSSNEDGRDSDEMFYVLKAIHGCQQSTCRSNP